MNKRTVAVRGDFVSVNSDSDSEPPLMERQATGRPASQPVSKEMVKLARQREREAKLREREAVRQRKAAEREARERERAEKRRVQQEEREARRAAQAAQRSSKPGECLKAVSVCLSPGVLQLPAGAAILAALQERDVRYDIQPQCHHNMISVWRQVTQPDTGGGLVTRDEPQDSVLLLLELDAFLNLINASSTKLSAGGAAVEDLLSHVTRVTESLENRDVTIIVQGLDKYYRGEAAKQKRRGESAKSAKRAKQSAAPSLSRAEIETVLVQLQLSVDCSIRFVDTDADVAKLVFAFVKAIAEIPFKQDRLFSGFSFHLESGGGAVAAEGEGLLRAWRQQLMQFKNVSAEVANTVVAAYPSPTALVKAYSACGNAREAELLLQNLVVRRGAGVMATTRRVGKELSRRVHLLLTSRDPALVLT